MLKKSLINSKYILIVVVFVLSCNLHAQIVNESLNNDIHDYLERLEIKNIIQLETEKKPFTIQTIKNKLKELQNKYNQLSNYEKGKLARYLTFYHLNNINIIYPYELRDQNAVVSIMPVGGYGIRFLNNKKGWERVGGIKIYGSYKNQLSIYAHLQDRGEFGNFIDTKKYISPERGYEFQKVKKGIEYSDVIGGISINTEWGSLALMKDYIRWGHGEFGQLILSDKVNSFPHVNFELRLMKNLRLKYLFGWLNSKVIDSNYYYESYPGSNVNERRYNFINKYIASNLLTFEPWYFLKFSLGNSIIYSGNSLRMEMFLPLAFYKYLDRDVGKGSISDGNGQMFFDFAIKPMKGLRLYSTFFVDVLSISKTLRGNYIENWFGYTTGMKLIDKPLNNSDFIFEFTKIEQWVYEHKDITTTYKHLNYLLGHWIGQNAYLISLKYSYYINSQINFSIKYYFLKKGGEEDIYYAYSGRKEKTLGFLYPPIKKDIVYEVSVNYEPFTSLILNFLYRYSIIRDDMKNRTPEFLMGQKHFYRIGFSFGFPY